MTLKKLWGEVSDIGKLIVYDKNGSRIEEIYDDYGYMRKYEDYKVINVYADIKKTQKDERDMSISIKPIIVACVIETDE